MRESALTKLMFQHLFADLRVTSCFTRPKSRGAKLFTQAELEKRLKIKAFVLSRQGVSGFLVGSAGEGAQ